jgi:type III secretion system YscQ/HrcQ family protein
LAQDDSSLDEIPVEVVFQAGRIEMQIGEVDSLAPGVILPLDRSVDDALDIVVNGRRIGRGGLVKIGEKLGVRVTRLSSDG